MIFQERRISQLLNWFLSRLAGPIPGNGNPTLLPNILIIETAAVMICVLKFFLNIAEKLQCTIAIRSLKLPEVRHPY